MISFLTKIYLVFNYFQEWDIYKMEVGKWN